LSSLGVLLMIYKLYASTVWKLYYERLTPGALFSIRKTTILRLTG
jgi:hypothetical protein